MLKVKVHGEYNKSDKKGDDNGLNCQCYECYQYPEPWGMLAYCSDAPMILMIVVAVA